MPVSVEMPRYQSHKKVWALKIANIDMQDGVTKIVPADEGYGPFQVDDRYLDKHNPVIGGYYVVYEDGYASFSPATAFEAGYTRI